MVGREGSNAPNPKKNSAAAVYKGPVKIALLKGAALLEIAHNI